MPKSSPETAAESVEAGAFTGRYTDLEGGYTVGFESFEEDVDLTERLKTLPHGLCQSPHWGYVFKGRLVYRSPDAEEAVHGGEAFFVPAGHTLLADAGTEFVFFSPTDVWQETMAAIAPAAPAHA